MNIISTSSKSTSLSLLSLSLMLSIVYPQNHVDFCINRPLWATMSVSGHCPICTILSLFILPHPPLDDCKRDGDSFKRLSIMSSHGCPTGFFSSPTYPIFCHRIFLSKHFLYDFRFVLLRRCVLQNGASAKNKNSQTRLCCDQQWKGWQCNEESLTFRQLKSKLAVKISTFSKRQKQCKAWEDIEIQIRRRKSDWPGERIPK